MNHNLKTTRNIGADAGLLTVSKVISSLIAMVMAMLLARIRTKTEMATYQQLLQMSDVVASILMLGMPKSLNFFLSKAENDHEKERFLSFYYTFNTILSLLVGAVLVLSAGLISEYLFHNPLIKGFLYFLAFFPWTRIITSSVENLLIVSRRQKQLIAYRFFNSISLLICVIIFVLNDFGFSAYMVAYLLIESLYALIVYALARNITGKLTFFFSVEMAKKVLAFSIPLGLSSIVGTLNTYLDRTIIGYFMPTEQYAVYSMAAKELPLTIVASTISAVLIPEMVRMLRKNKYKDAISLWGESISLSLSVLAFFGTACIVYAKDVLMVLYGEQYATHESAIVFSIYALYLVIRCTYYGMALNAMGKSRWILRCSLLTLMSNAVLNIVLFLTFRRWGAEFYAPAVATILTTIVMNSLQLSITSKLMGISIREIFPWKSAGSILLLNAAFGICFFFIKRLLPLESLLSFEIGSHVIDGSAFESILLSIGWALLYGALMFNKCRKIWQNLSIQGE